MRTLSLLALVLLACVTARTPAQQIGDDHWACKAARMSGPELWHHHCVEEATAKCLALNLPVDCWRDRAGDKFSSWPYHTCSVGWR